MPVGRVGRPDEIADFVLAVVRNGFMTNHVMGIDGGDPSALIRPGASASAAGAVSSIRSSSNMTSPRASRCTGHFAGDHLKPLDLLLAAAARQPHDDA